MQSQGLTSAQAERLEALRRKHFTLKQKIKEERKRPALDEQKIYSLKQEKLRLKDEIEGLRVAS